MRTLPAEEAVEQLEGLIHLDTQKGPNGVDLTVDSIHKIGEGGCLDFGGSEYREAEQLEMRAEREARDDDYGWWKLTPGDYIVEYNESFVGDGEARIYPHTRLLQSGASHASFQPRPGDPLKVLLHVGEGGVHVKENARVSTLVIEA
ncbi:MAG: dCTP deaminase [Myxococcota bacterium]